MTRAKEANVKFNKEKVLYKVSSVNYMGHIVTSEGVKVEYAKVKAIAEMPPPTDNAMEVDLCLYYAIKNNGFESKTFHNAIKK